MFCGSYDMVCTKLKNNNFTVINEDTKSLDLILDNKNSILVYYFEIKELPNWRFGLVRQDTGLEDEDKYMYVFIGDVDIKFAKLNLKYYVKDYYLNSFLDSLKEIERNPKTCLVDALVGFSKLKEFNGTTWEFVLNEYNKYLEEKSNEQKTKE